jgi:hypothetical protein
VQDATKLRDALLIRALDRRIESVDALGRGARELDLGPPSDPEESLRLLMVRLWPAASRRDATGADWERLLRSAIELSGSAERDLRFLDAFNNVYESLEVASDLPSSDLVDAFATTYSRILKLHRARLIDASA